MDMFNFDDDEPKKKKKAKSKKNKNKRTVQTREYFETKITNLNGRLAYLRSVFLLKNEANRKLVQELVTIEEDHVDVCEFLERTIIDRKASIKELYNTLKKLETQRDEYTIWSKQRIAELQKQFAADRDQLQSEIVLQQKSLHSLNEFRLNRDKALEEFQTYNDGIAKLERQAQEDLYNMEQMAAIQKSVLKKEVEDKLDHLVEDFLHSYEIRNASYTRNLIHENIALTKRMDKLVQQNVRTMEVREKQYLKTKEIMESYTSIEQLCEQLQRTIKNKNDIINQLTVRIDRMRMKYIDARRFRRLHDFAKSRGLCDKNGPKNFDEVVRYLERLNNDKNAIIQQQRVQENEILCMRKVLDTLQIAVEKTISALQQLGPGECLEPTDRRAIINELIFLTISESLEKSHNSNGVYRLGSCGLVLPEYRNDVPLNVLFVRPISKPEPCAKSDESTIFKLNMSHTLPTIDEYSLEHAISLNEQIGDGPKNPSQNYITAKEMLDKEWLQIDLLADTMRTDDLFKGCFKNMPLCGADECNSDFLTSNSESTSMQGVELVIKTDNFRVFPIDK